MLYTIEYKKEFDWKPMARAYADGHDLFSDGRAYCYASKKQAHRACINLKSFGPTKHWIKANKIRLRIMPYDRAVR